MRPLLQSVSVQIVIQAFNQVFPRKQVNAFIQNKLSRNTNEACFKCKLSMRNAPVKEVILRCSEPLKTNVLTVIIFIASTRHIFIN